MKICITGQFGIRYGAVDYGGKYAEQFVNNLEKIGEIEKANIVRDKYSKEFK